MEKKFFMTLIVWKFIYKIYFFKPHSYCILQSLEKLIVWVHIYLLLVKIVHTLNFHWNLLHLKIFHLLWRILHHFIKICMFKIIPVTCILWRKYFLKSFFTIRKLHISKKELSHPNLYNWKNKKQKLFSFSFLLKIGYFKTIFNAKFKFYSKLTV